MLLLFVFLPCSYRGEGEHGPRVSSFVFIGRGGGGGIIDSGGQAGGVATDVFLPFAYFRQDKLLWLLFAIEISRDVLEANL